MIKNLRVLLHCSVFALMPMMAGAAGTYYTYNGTIQRNYGSYTNPGGGNPFYNYGANDTHRLQNNGCAGANCNAQMNRANYNQNYNQNMNKNSFDERDDVSVNKAKYVNNSSDEGLRLTAGLSHQFADWKFDMKTAGSILHYDNIRWNILDAGGQYDFDLGSTKVRLDAGLQYGWQYGDSSMVDDDITGGGYFLQDWYVDLDDDGDADQVWSQQGHAVSVGTSNDGDMLGIHAGLGLTNVWNVGGLKITPSVGYRYFKYKLETKRNYGLSLDTISGADNYCQSAGGETQCLPFLVFVDSANSPLLGTIDARDLDDDGVADTVSYVTIPGGAQFLETENTYYYYQGGVSHSYEVEWSGPYVALDMQYDITNDDAVKARVELGLPAYTATGDQPYRPDWQHPKSLEDTGSIGDAYHFGFLANWLHSLTDSVMLSVGMTFDYYHISGATATSYFNPDYYNTYYYDPAVTTNTALVNHYGNTDYENWSGTPLYDSVAQDQDVYLTNLDTIAYIDAVKSNGWKQEAKDEIDSFYKSLGIRVGIQAKF